MSVRPLIIWLYGKDPIRVVLGGQLQTFRDFLVTSPTGWGEVGRSDQSERKRKPLAESPCLRRPHEVVSRMK